jgi:predicted amidohydrolase YtcJ
MLDMFERIENKNQNWDRRFRIEHAQHLRDSDVKRFFKLNVLASMQPVHLLDDGNWAVKRLGSERIKSSYKIKSLLNKKASVSFGTDWPVASLNPLLGIYAAVTRKNTDENNPEGWIPEEKISVQDAVKCYTLNSAYAGFQEKIIGSIETGKYADFVVLSDDIFSISPDKIKDVKVEMTVFNGEVIFKR